MLPPSVIRGTAPRTGVSFAGVAPQASILSIKITNSDTFPGQVTAQAIRDAVNLGANVIKLSLATNVSTPALLAAVQFAQARNVVVVAAAGNDDPDGVVGPFYPAAYPGVLSVGAIGPDGSLASFSDTRTPVSVTATGVDVTSAYPGTFPQAYNPGDNGTSFATAFVTTLPADSPRDNRESARPAWVKLRFGSGCGRRHPPRFFPRSWVRAGLPRTRSTSARRHRR